MSDILEKEVKIPVVEGHVDLLNYFETYLRENLEEGYYPIRFVVSKTDDEYYHCDVGCFRGEWPKQDVPSIFEQKHRTLESTDKFNIALIVPTGVGAIFGGHAGDATPLAQLFGSVCDRLITHPNVVNASDINEMPFNTLYVEGSVLTRLMMGTVGLQPVRANRILAILEDHEDVSFVDNTVNAINAARACYGLDCENLVVLYPSFEMDAFESPSGRAIGHVTQMEHLFAALDKYKGEYDAIAIASIIRTEDGVHEEYFESDGDVVNPWGGVEAMLTHTVSHFYDVPAAHGPITELAEHEDLDVGVVDPRMSAEIISTSFLQCVLKGLQRSPRVVTDPVDMTKSQILTAEDVSVLVQPDGCLGVPVLAALEQGIPVIAVRENKNFMDNPLEKLPWARGQFHQVETYFEAVGLIQSMKAGIGLNSLKRPLHKAEVNLFMHDAKKQTNVIMDYYGEEAEALEKFTESDFDYTVDYATEKDDLSLLSDAKDDKDNTTDTSPS